MKGNAMKYVSPYIKTKAIDGCNGCEFYHPEKAPRSSGEPPHTRWCSNGSYYAYTDCREGRTIYTKRETMMHELKNEIRLGDLKGDPWGTSMTWWFAIADELHFNRFEPIPEHWHHKPGIGPDDDNDYYASVFENHTVEDLTKFGNLLCHYTAALDRAGKSY